MADAIDPQSIAFARQRRRAGVSYQNIAKMLGCNEIDLRRLLDERPRGVAAPARVKPASQPMSSAKVGSEARPRPRRQLRRESLPIRVLRAIAGGFKGSTEALAIRAGTSVNGLYATISYLRRDGFLTPPRDRSFPDATAAGRAELARIDGEGA